MIFITALSITSYNKQSSASKIVQLSSLQTAEASYILTDIVITPVLSLLMCFSLLLGFW